MKQILFIITGLLMFYTCKNESATEDLNRQVNFNREWKFMRGDAVNADKADFDDSSWRAIDLPHDYSIEDLPEKSFVTQVGPFTPESEGGPSTGHFKGGTGWYRKHFRLGKADKGKQISVLFDGVYMDSDIWLNGIHLGNHPYGYTPFFFDLTPYLNPAGKENVLAVRVKNTGKNSRWYSGSGIYRHVWLVRTDPVHISQWGTFITTPEVNQKEALVTIETTIENESENDHVLQVRSVILNPEGVKVGEESKVVKIDAGEKGKAGFNIKVTEPQLWSLLSPELYHIRIIVKNGREVKDRTEISFGIRKTEFSPEKGFLLNGENILLKGGCLHHDNGPLGSAAFDAAEYRRVRIMKENGFNAIRTSHNPPSQQFLDACDQLGMLVIDEAFDQWQLPKNEMDYSRFFDQWWEKDIESMVLRDRNHPSVIIWSIGNEIRERADSSGLEIALKLKRKIQELDPTRPVTQAICHFWESSGRKWDDSAPAFRQMDLHGYNYL